MKEPKRLSHVDASGIRKMFERGIGMKQPIDVSLGMPDYPVPQSVKDAAIENISNKTGYSVTQGALSVREEVARKLQAKNDIPAAADEVVITGGATAGLALAILASAQEGDEVIIIDPWFVQYKQIIAFSGATAVPVSAYPTFDLPLEGIQKAITPKTKAILINTPGNPTGKIYSREQLEVLAEIAKENDLLIISDEVYEEILFEGKHVSIASMYPKTVTIMSPSKTASVAGWRIGYLHAPKELIPSMLKLQQILYVCAPVPAQEALKASLFLDYQSVRDELQKRRDFLVQELNITAEMIPHGAFYFFLPVHNDDAEEAMETLVADEVLTVPGEVFSRQNTHIRISFASPFETIKKAVPSLKKVLPKREG